MLYDSPYGAYRGEVNSLVGEIFFPNEGIAFFSLGRMLGTFSGGL